MDEIDSYFITFFRDHSFLNYILVAFSLLVALIGYAGGRRCLFKRVRVFLRF